MNRTEKYLIEEKIANLNSNPHVLFSVQNSTNEYKSLLKFDSHEYFIFALSQCTITPLPGNHLEDILSLEGQELFRNVCKKVKDNLFKDYITNYSVDNIYSGAWFALENSPWYNKSKFYGDDLKGLFYTLNNKCVKGTSETIGNIQTSPCVFLIEPSTTQDGWCYTKSGSLYQLKHL